MGLYRAKGLLVHTGIGIEVLSWGQWIMVSYSLFQPLGHTPTFIGAILPGSLKMEKGRVYSVHQHPPSLQKQAQKPTANTRLLAYLTFPTALASAKEAITDCLKASSDSYLVVEASNRRPARVPSSRCDRWWMRVMCR